VDGMKYQLEVTPKQGYLEVVVKGDNTPETVMRYLKEVYEACLRLKCPNVLVEENLEGPGLDLGEIFGVVAEGSKSVWPVVRCIAYVDVNRHHDQKNMKFAETVGVNRSVNIRVFRTVPEAENWIAGQVDLPPENP
jgi:hypothetical protein